MTNLLHYAECIDKKYGGGTFVSNKLDISKRCNQKCIDVAKKRRKRIQAAADTN